MARLLTTNKTPEQPPLLHVADDPKVKELTAELAQFQERLTADTARLERAEHALREAQDALDVTESRLLAGRTDEATFAAAQATLAEGKRAHALALHAREDAARMVTLLPAALTEARIAARKQVVANLRTRYAAQVSALKAALLAAADANQAVQETYQVALAELPANTRYEHPELDGVWYCEDLGDGVTSKAARLADVTFPPLVVPFHRHTSALADWLTQAEALLALIPQMAAIDQETLTRRLAHEPERRAREAEKAKLALSAARRDVERFG